MKNPGGAERVLSLIANKLDSLGYNISILSYYNESDSFYPLSKNIDRFSLNYEMSTNKVVKVFSFIKMLFVCRRIVKSKKIDFIIPLGNESAMIIALSLFYLKRIRKIVWIHYSFFHTLNFKAKIFRKYLIHSFEKIVVLNKTDTIKFSELYPDKVVHIPNPASFISKDVSKLNYNKIIAVGRIDRIKGFDKLIKSFKIVMDDLPNNDWKLQIIGQDGGEKASLTKLIEKLNLGNNVFIENAVSNIKLEYLLSDIYVMSSITESFGMVLLEAQEVGLPIVSFDCDSGPRDIVKNGVNGFLVNPYDIKELAKAMLSLIKDPELRKKMGVNAKQNVQSYNIEKIITKWVKLF
jgi:glycosyltransferase involved in cell wall biosynthesis